MAKILMEVQGRTGPGVILRMQQVPNRYRVVGGDLFDGDRKVFDNGNRVFQAVQGAEERHIYDPSDGSITPPPPPDPGVVKRRERPVNAEQRLAQILEIPAVRAIKTPADGRQYVANNASNLSELGAIVGNLLAVVVNDVRLGLRDKDTIFPADE